MNDIRSFASLSGSLLARKGGAKPAMRPRALGSGGMLDDLGWDDMGDADQPSEHVPSSLVGLTPVPRTSIARDEQPSVHLQQRALADRYPTPPVEPELGAGPEALDEIEPEPIVAIAPAPAPHSAADIVPLPKRPAASAAVSGRKAAFTLRLDAGRHLRLRLATAVTGQSAQQLVTGALDRFLESLPEVGTMAEQLPTRSSKRS